MGKLRLSALTQRPQPASLRPVEHFWIADQQEINLQKECCGCASVQPLQLSLSKLCESFQTY